MTGAKAITVGLIVISGMGSVGSACAQDVRDGFEGRRFSGSTGLSMPYRLFVPDVRLHDRHLPLIVYLHGGAAVGDDNLKQIGLGNVLGTHVWITNEMQSRHPAFVVAPQLPSECAWGAPESEELSPYAALVLELVSALREEFGIDADRVYLMGQSLGGYGTWDVISKRPDVFAAAVPLCAGGNPSRIIAAREVPIWAFHGVKDERVPVMASREMVAALRTVGAAVKYTEYPEAAHDVWMLAFIEPELPTWLFSQKRSDRKRKEAESDSRG